MNYRGRVQAFEIIKEEEKNIVSDMLQAAVIYFVLASVFSVWFSAFQIPEDINVGYGRMFLCVAVVFFLLYKTKHKSVWLILLSGAWLAGLVWNLQTIIKGLAPFVNSYIRLRNSFYGESIVELPLYPTDNEINFALFMVQIMFLLIFMEVMQNRKLWIFALAYMLLPVIIAATVGEMPSVYSAEALLISGVMYLLCYHGQGEAKIKEMAKVVVILLIVFAVSMAILPKIENYKKVHISEYKQMKTKLVEGQVNFDIQDLLPDIFQGDSDFSKGGIGKGKLKDLSNVSPKGIKDMEVTVSQKPSDRVYLKAFTGAVYTGEKWEELDESKMEEITGKPLSQDEYRILMNMPYRVLNNYEDSQKLTVNIMKGSKAFGYAPYYSEIPEDKEVIMDAYVDGDGKRSHTYQYYENGLKGYQEYNIYAEIPDKEMELWYDYCMFVEDNYSMEPEQLTTLDILHSIFYDLSLGEVSDEIDEWFGNGLIYDRSPGANPEGKDFVEYFLYENKKGFCVHFATAATLIYRVCGYPARYVEGYAIPPNAFQEQSDGTYKAVVTDEMAHAWCEVFGENEGMGWEVKEHTPPYRVNSQTIVRAVSNNGNSAQGAGGNEVVTQNNTTTEQVTQKETVVGGSGKTGDSGLSGAGKSSKKTTSIIKNLLIFVMVPMVLVVAVVFLWRYRKVRKIQSFRNRKNNIGIANMYNEICKISALTVKEENKSEREMFV